MPVASFAGARGWGYDGVGLFAPHAAYGGPEGLKRFVDAAHAAGLGVLLDLVHNHFGPDGAYIHRIAPEFFTNRRKTPWGAAIDFAKPAVRSFFLQNAAYWIEEYRLDGYRYDAIDQIDRIPENAGFLAEIAEAARAAAPDRPIHLCTEDDRNIVDLHPWEDGAPRLYTAEWNDDFHHVAHVAATGETVGYYSDYAGDHAARMARMLSSGFDYQGAPSPHLGHDRGAPSGGQPPLAFVNFLQNHDQVGNRAMGERLGALAAPRAVEALTAILLAGAADPAPVHGRGMGRAPALPLLHRFPRRPRPRRAQGPARRIRLLARFQGRRRPRRHTRPERARNLRRRQARLGRDGSAAGRRAAGAGEAPPGPARRRDRAPPRRDA
jgi:maltooligosyltrehalose trehalohydrolase